MTPSPQVSTPSSQPADPNDFTNYYNTPIPPNRQQDYNNWSQQQQKTTGKNPENDKYDYDVNGYFLSGQGTDARGHADDQFKKPNHPTFSDFSQYNNHEGNVGGHWDLKNKTFTPSATNLKHYDAGDLQDYFNKQEPDYKLNMPSSNDFSEFQKKPDDYSEFQVQKTPDSPASTPEEKYSVSGFLSNILPSAGRFASNVGQGLKDAVTSPSIAGPLGMAYDAYKDPRSLTQQGQDTLNKFKAIGSNLKDRYGSLSKIGSTMYHDPVGAAADASTVLDPLASGLEAIPAASKAARLARVASDVTNPLQAVTRPIAAIGRGVTKGGSESLMKSAINDTGALNDSQKTVAPSAREMIQEGITMTPKGMNKTSSIIDPAIANRDKIISDMENAGATIDPSVVRQHGIDAINKVGKSNMSKEYTTPMKKLLDEYDTDNHVEDYNNPGSPDLSKPIPIKPSAAQESKETDYSNLDYTRPLVDDPFKEQFRKAIAHGTMKALEDQSVATLGQLHPSLHESNATYGKMAPIRKAVQQALLDQESGASGSNIALAGGHAMTPHGATMQVSRNAIRKVLNHPKVKSQISIALDRVNKGGTGLVNSGVNRTNLQRAGQASKYTITPQGESTDLP